MNLHSRRAQKHGRNTARAVGAPLVLSLAFVAMTGLIPQRAYAQVVLDDLAGLLPYFIASDGTITDSDAPAATIGNAADGIRVYGGFGGSASGVVGTNVTVTVADGVTIGAAGGNSLLNGGDASIQPGANGGQALVQLGARTTFADNLTIAGGNASGTGGAGGDVTLRDGGAASVTTFMGNLEVRGGNIDLANKGGAASVNLAGTMRFVDTGAAHTLKFFNPSYVTGNKVNADIGTLELVTTTVTMTLSTLTYAAGAATEDNVDLGTLKLTNGGFFNTGATVRNSVSEYTAPVSFPPTPQQYTVKNIHITGNGNIWNTAGSYNPGDTGGTVAFDVTGVNPGGAMLAMYNDAVNATPTTKSEGVSFGNFNTVNGHANPNLIFDPATKDAHRSLIGGTFALIDGASFDVAPGNQWLLPPSSTVTNSVRYYAQNGASRFYYDTFGLANDATVNGFTNDNTFNLMATGVGELNPAKAYSQYQAAVAETAADVFLNNTWVANRDVVDIAQPDAFALTGRVSYWAINQDQGHYSEADKDMLGAAISGGYKVENGAGETTLGAFVEYGHGEYDTDTTLRGWGGSQGTFGLGSDQIRGDGDADLFGGGLFVYHDFMEGTYLDGGFRFGTVNQTFRVKGHGLDHRTRIDTDTGYWGLNFGVGHKFQLTDCANLDLYGKFLWTRLDGNNFTNGYGDRIEMDAVDSIRTRVGARMTQGLGDGNLSVYYGAAWEQEWDGEATGKYSGYRITEAADNSGASAFGELGLSYKPQGQNFAIEAGVFGLAGSQQGGGGTVGLKFDF